MTATEPTPFMEIVGVPGLRVCWGALDASRASEAAQTVAAYLGRDGRPFTHRTALARYGYDYSPEPVWLSTIPQYFATLANFLELECNSVSLARYERNDHIDPHIDLPCWERVAILNLGAQVNVTMHAPTGLTRICAMGAGDLLDLAGDALRVWKHSVWARQPRFSIVFRYRQPPAADIPPPPKP